MLALDESTNSGRKERLFRVTIELGGRNRRGVGGFVNARRRVGGVEGVILPPQQAINSQRSKCV